MCFFPFFLFQDLTWYLTRASSYDDVIRNIIGYVGSTIYLVNEVLLIYHTLLTLHIYAIYIYIYNMHIRYIQYILHIRYIYYIRKIKLFYKNSEDVGLAQKAYKQERNVTQ